MSNLKVSADGGLASAIMQVLKEFDNEVMDAVDESVTEASKRCLKEIKSNAPVKSGAYKSAWTTKVESSKRGNKKVVLWAGKKYRVAHLLEHGHAKVNGGRVPGRPHIGPAESNMLEYFPQMIEEKIKG